MNYTGWVGIVLQRGAGILSLQLGDSQIGDGDDGDAFGLNSQCARVWRDQIGNRALHEDRHWVEGNGLRCQILLCLLPKRLKLSVRNSTVGSIVKAGSRTRW